MVVACIFFLTWTQELAPDPSPYRNVDEGCQEEERDQKNLSHLD
jgi:hypothetical protein